METTWVFSGVLFDGDGDWFLLGAIVMVLVGVMLGVYTRTGSGISGHPRGPRR